MKSMQLAAYWEKIADLLEILGESPYRAGAYRRGARTIATSPYSLEELSESGELGKLPGIGAALLNSAEEFLKTGSLELFQKLQGQVGDELYELVQAGVTPKLAGRLSRELGIENLATLDDALGQGKLQTIPGIGLKREQELAKIVARSKKGKDFPAPSAELTLTYLISFLEELPQTKAAIAGGIRRGEELVSCGVLVVGSSYTLEELGEYLQGFPLLEEREKGLTLKLEGGLLVQIVTTSPSDFYRTLWEETGTPEHLALLEELGPIPEKPKTEEAIYRALALPLIPPELRLGAKEVELAKAGQLPPDLGPLYLGDLHVHSDYSDGRASLAQLQAEGEALGYRYLAICDHSKSLAIAGGLSLEQLRARNREIDALNHKGSPCRLLKGIELEIGKEGQLDYPSLVLAELDIVVGAIHRRFEQGEAELMERIERAFETGQLHIFAHPTGRLLGRREPLPIKMEELLALAREYNVALELNASPHRLDLNAEHLKMAKVAQVAIAINTDSHSLEALGRLTWAFKLARRAGLTGDDVLNTMELASLKKRIKN